MYLEQLLLNIILVPLLGLHLFNSLLVGQGSWDTLEGSLFTVLFEFVAEGLGFEGALLHLLVFHFKSSLLHSHSSLSGFAFLSQLP